jgi:hypothetical protein
VSEPAVLTKTFSWRDDPVLTFILDPKTYSVAMGPLSSSSMPNGPGGPSHRRTQLAGLALMQKRCEELGWPELTSTVALAWQAEAREELG